jgi:hypothetical protein
MKLGRVLQTVTGSTADRIAAERGAIAGIERLIVELEQQRVRNLTDDDPTKALQTADAIAANKRALSIRQERLTAFQAQARKEELDRRERQRTEDIDNIVVPKLARCAALTKDLVKALAAVDDVRRELREVRDGVFRNWPASIPQTPYSHFSLSIIESRLTKAFGVAADRLHSTSRLADIANTSGDWMTSPLVAEVERQVANYLDELRQVPIVQPSHDELDGDVEAAA